MAVRDPWRDEEMVLGLHVYLRHRNERLSRDHTDVKALSHALRRLAELDGRVIVEEFRNPAGVAMQLSKFLELEQAPVLRGLGTPSRWQREIWARYAEDPDALQRRVDEITSRLGVRWPSLPVGPGASAARESHDPQAKVAREALLDVFGPEQPEGPRAAAGPVEVDSRKHDRADETHDALRMELGRFLGVHGFAIHGSVKARPDGAEVIRFDLVATRGPLTLLVEVKSLPPGGDDHEPLRKGLGQLLWYRSRWRRLVKEPCIAVLLVERRPACARQWLDACGDVAVVLTWPERLGTLLVECERLAALSAPATFR